MPFDAKHSMTKHHYCAIGLSNPKTPSNVGSVLRAGVCLGADEIFYTGVRYDRAQRFNTNTTSSELTTPLTHVTSITEAAKLANPDVKTVCVELVENATPLPDFIHPPQALYIFGPEDYNLSQDTIDESDYVVFIPVQQCLNLSATVNILLYDRMIKNSTPRTKTEYNNMIRSSRDCRNNLRVTPDVA